MQHRGGGNTPLTLSVSLASDSHTLYLARQARAWTLCFIDNVQHYAHFGLKSGWQIDKFALLQTRRSKVLEMPVLDDALACLELEQTAELEVGRNFILAGKVVGGEVLRKGESLYDPVGASAWLS